MSQKPARPHVLVRNAVLPNGDVYLEQPYSRQQNLTSNNLSFRDYYRGAVDTNSTYLGNVVKSASSNRSQAFIGVPLYFPSNQSLLGIWAGGIDFAILNNEIQSLNLGCSDTSSFIHVTSAPTGTVTFDGLNL